MVPGSPFWRQREMTQGPWDAWRGARAAGAVPWREGDAVGSRPDGCSVPDGRRADTRAGREHASARGGEGQRGSLPPAQNGMPFETCESFPEFSAFDFGLQLTTGN